MATKFIKMAFAKADDKVTVKLGTDNESIGTDLYCCTIKPMVGNSTQLKTVLRNSKQSHIRRKSQDMHFFPKGREWQKCWSHLFHEVLLFVHLSWTVGNTTAFRFKST